MPEDEGWRKLTEEQRRILYREAHQAARDNEPPSLENEAEGDDLYFPGHIHVSEELLKVGHYKTVSDPTNDRNDIYWYKGKTYERGEEFIRSEAQRTYLKLWNNKISECNVLIETRQGPETQIKNAAKLLGRLKNAIHKGPTVNDINEVLADIRRATYTAKESMNPPTHIPFLNGLLNIRTRALEPFSPDLFFTWQIEANYLGQHVTLLDVPKFRYYLNSVFYEVDIPTVLSYGGYTLQPGFPRHKVHIIAGRERIGKGVWTRLLKEFNPKGFGSVSWEKLLINENRFAFQGVLGKNLLVDPEMKRIFRKGFKPDYANFNKLFGGDIIDLERKGRDPQNHVNNAKGTFIANLPISETENPAVIARCLITRTRDSRLSPEIPNIELDILATERDKIATLLILCYFGLEDRNFIFPGELENSSTQELWSLLADPVENFIEEMTEPMEGSEVKVDLASEVFDKWCANKGIPTPAKQTFTSKFKWSYPKKRAGTRGNRYYVFMNCQIPFENEFAPQGKLDTGENGTKPLVNRAFWNRFKRVQLKSYSNNYFYNLKNNIYKEYAPKLDTGISESVALENAGFPSMENGVQPPNGETPSQDHEQGYGKQDGNLGNSNNQLPNLPTQTPYPQHGETNHNFSKEDLASRIKDYLNSHNGIENIGRIYQLATREWYSGIEGERLQELIAGIKEGYGLSFNYATQYVSLKEPNKRDPERGRKNE